MVEGQYRIVGMQCEACVEKIKTVLQPIAPNMAISFEPPRLSLQKEISLTELNNRLAQAGKYHVVPWSESTGEQKGRLKTYYPIFLIAGYIASVAMLTSVSALGINWHGLMNTFMAGFFLVFSAFKLLDIRGFADAYATYDLLAKRWQGYGNVYPFLELGLGLLYLIPIAPTLTHSATVVLMGFSSLGVINALAKKQTIRCACLGTVLNIPMSSITLIEDLTMIVMAAAMLICW